MRGNNGYERKMRTLIARQQTLIKKLKTQVINLKDKLYAQSPAMVPRTVRRYPRPNPAWNKKLGYMATAGIAESQAKRETKIISKKSSRHQGEDEKC